MNDDLIKYNDDETVNVPFGRVAEWYISKHPLLKNIKLKCQSRKKTPELVKENIITVDRVEGAVNYIEWRTNKGETKSTNRIDDIVHLTPMGEEYVKEIEAGKRKDRLCWSWTMYCTGGNSCQRKCGNIGSCKENCANRNFPNNIKNSHNMHLCKVRVISESKLSWLKTSKPLRIKIIGSHLSANALNTHIPNSSKLNLTREIWDKIILNRRSNYKTAKEIKMTLLAPYNGANEETLWNVLNDQCEICNDTKLRGFIKRDDRRLKENPESWTILHYLVTEILKLKGYVLYYQQPDPLAPEDHPDHYYQLTLSNDLWLKNGQKFGNFCIGLDGTYDLNNDHVPILTVIVENNTGCATPLAFSLSNKENNWTIRLAIQANIPCSRSECNHEWYYQDLPSGKGFERISNCANIQLWNPLAMIDKHRPSRIAIQSLLRGSILCWFHIMKTIGENFRNGIFLVIH